METSGVLELGEIANKKKSEFIAQQTLIVLFVITSFLFFNPFIALFFASLLAVYFNVPKWSILIFGTLGFTIFFFSREYNVAWASSSDDVPAYLELYFSDKSISFIEVFTRFFHEPGDHEPLWHAPFWILLNIFNGDDKSFIFVHYFLIFSLLIYTMISISDRYYIVLILAYFFLTPVALDSVFHIWRQQLASTLFLLGCDLYLIKGKKYGLVILSITVFFHLICLYFIGIFLVFNFLRRRNYIRNNVLLLMYVLLLCAGLILVFEMMLKLLASFNLDRVTAYADGADAMDMRFFIVMSILMGSLFVCQIIRDNDNLNKLIIFITFVVTTMSIAFPFANAIFTRLSYFTVPLVGLYFVRWFVQNFPQKWMLAFVLITFSTGLIRIIPLITKKMISAQFLAYGHPLDPLMGIIRLAFFQ